MTPADQLHLAELIRDAINDIVRIEGGPVRVSTVRVVPAAAFFDHSFSLEPKTHSVFTHGTTLYENGELIVRIAVGRPADQVVDTILHECAHVLLDSEHNNEPCHGQPFQDLYQYLKRKYTGVMKGELSHG
jgi:hypothetical protein